MATAPTATAVPVLSCEQFCEHRSVVVCEPFVSRPAGLSDLVRVLLADRDISPAILVIYKTG